MPKDQAGAQGEGEHHKRNISMKTVGKNNSMQRSDLAAVSTKKHARKAGSKDGGSSGGPKEATRPRVPQKNGKQHRYGGAAARSTAQRVGMSATKQTQSPKHRKGEVRLQLQDSDYDDSRADSRRFSGTLRRSQDDIELEADFDLMTACEQFFLHFFFPLSLPFAWCFGMTRRALSNMGLIPNDIGEVFNNWVLYVTVWVMNFGYAFVYFTHGEQRSVYFSSVMVANFLFAFRCGSIAIKYGYTSRSFYQKILNEDHQSFHRWQSSAMLGTGWGPLEDPIIHAQVRFWFGGWLS